MNLKWECECMKLTYKAQVIISVIIIILGNVLTDIFDSWIYRSMAFAICGLLFIVHPIVPNYLETNKTTIFWTRIAGILLIIIGVLTRVYH